jgi:tRNA(fMet)-specific endonuclease VapC
MFILDTDICIYLLNGAAPAAAEKLHALQRKDVGVTSITAAELRYGALHSKNAESNMVRVEQFLSPLQQFAFDNRAAVHFAVIKERLASTGRLIGPMDMLIAAIVINIDGILVTNNVREFERVSNLKLENWK